MTLEVMDSKIKATCFFGEEQSTERNKAIHPNSIVINVFFLPDHVKIQNGLLDILDRIKGQYLFYFALLRICQTPL